ncbi:MAG: barstar family protein [Proteobacteria bacterium]|nr:barstar family protein [Pseudomonadota bacterium]
MNVEEERAIRFDTRLSGVYRTQSAAPARAAEGVLEVLRVPLGGVATRDALFERFRESLDFPDWFGANWDALEDCLDDFSWREDRSRLLLIDGWEPFAAGEAEAFAVLLEILAASGAFWAGQSRGFFVALVDPHGVLDVPDLGDALHP